VTKSIQSLSKNHTPPCSDREHQAHPPTVSSTVGNNAENIDRQKATAQDPTARCRQTPLPQQYRYCPLRSARDAV